MWKTSDWDEERYRRRMSSPVEPLLVRAEALGVHLEPGRAEVLLAYEKLLRTRGVGIGAISEGDRERIRDRHLLDALRGATAVEPSDRTSYDLGSGAGLPGIPVAIACPELRVGLVESRRRRVSFLELAVDELGLSNVAVFPGRLEELTERVDLCFARALASPGRSWSLAAPLLRTGGRLVYFAGAGYQLGSQGTGDELARVILRSPSLESSGPLVIMSQP